jgi:hypothetical protein
MITILRLKPILYAVAVNLFIVFVVCRAVFMCWPFEQEYNPRKLLPWFSMVSSYMGLDADLVLFSPNPPNNVEELQFIVTFEDGTSKECKLARDKMTPWDSEHSYPVYVRNAFLWSSRRSPLKARKYLARFIARQAATADKRPVKVDFLLSRETIPPPEIGMGKGLVYGHSFAPFYTYVVKPGDLK